MDALDTLIDRATVALRAAGINGPRREARLLAALALGCSPDMLLTSGARHVGDREASRFRAFVERRAHREPLSRIRGRREFWSLEFELGATTLDPRPDSETLVEAALALLPPEEPARIVDFGTGTGCLLVAVLSERPRATGMGVDLDPDAIAIATANAARIGLGQRAQFVRADWRRPASLPEGPFDLVLANPPYIPTDALADLAPEVARFDPRVALDGGADGLEAYRSLAPALAGLLDPGGSAVVEIGQGQGDAVATIFAAAGFPVRDRRLDLAGIPRCLVLGGRA